VPSSPSELSSSTLATETVPWRSTDKRTSSLPTTDMSNLASEPWAPHIWYRDPRFSRFVPKGDLTVYQVATSGAGVDRRFLWEHGNELRDAVDAQARLSLLDAISQYVEAISGQHGERLDALLACTGLNGLDPITGADAARRLGVSHQRMSQIVGQLYRARDRACPPQGDMDATGRYCSQERLAQQRPAKLEVSDSRLRCGQWCVSRDFDMSAPVCGVVGGHRDGSG
jgi:hypothetical protein